MCSVSKLGLTEQQGAQLGACMHACNLPMWPYFAWASCMCDVFRASEGADGARDLLALTPCDLFPYMRGRTLWLVGDSMMQVGPSARFCEWLGLCSRCVTIFMQAELSGSAPSWLSGARHDRHDLQSRR